MFGRPTRRVNLARWCEMGMSSKIIIKQTHAIIQMENKFFQNIADFLDSSTPYPACSIAIQCRCYMYFSVLKTSVDSLRVAAPSARQRKNEERFSFVEGRVRLHVAVAIKTHSLSLKSIQWLWSHLGFDVGKRL